MFAPDPWTISSPFRGFYRSGRLGSQLSTLTLDHIASASLNTANALHAEAMGVIVRQESGRTKKSPNVSGWFWVSGLMRLAKIVFSGFENLRGRRAHFSSFGCCAMGQAP